MKYNNSNIKILTLFLLFGLITTAIFAANINSKKISFTTKSIYSIFAPDTIPTDTVSATAIYNVTDTFDIYSDGLDSIVMLHEDTSTYYVQGDTTLPYYIGSPAEQVIFERSIDTIAYYYATDSAAYYIPANDSIAYSLINADTLFSDPLYEANAKLNLTILESKSAINIHMGKDPKTINQGLFGINLEGLFKPSSLPNDGLDGGTSQYTYDWLSELSPAVLRFPSGESGKLMHLLNNTDGTDAVDYGYDIYEIARYFNWTDGFMNVIDDDDIFYENIDPEILLSTLSVWMNADRVDDYLKFRNKYKTQLCETRRYIDDFIFLVHKINAENPGRPAVKVILSLNIISETATECKSIADYLRSNNVNVIGVEIGNETYAPFYCETVGFRYCKLHTTVDGDNDDNYSGNYWDYINGCNYSDDALSTASSDLNQVLSEDMWNDHDFIGAFKNVGGYNYKVGLVGSQLGNPYAFKLDEISGIHLGCDPNGSWNSDLNSLYGEMVGTDHAFDAVILHNYYSADNWMGTPIDPSNFILNPSCNEANATDLDDRWHFDYADSRLQNAFKKIKGVGGVYGNFRDFIINHPTPGDYPYSIQASFAEFNNQLQFDMSSEDPDKKELWMTEWNLKDVLPGYDASDPIDVENQKKILIYDNSFMHGVLLMQWLMKNIKLNFESPYRQNFFTYATIQNYAGGVWTDLLTLSDHQERVEQSMNYWPCDGICPAPCLECIDDPKWNKRNYWMRRTSYFVTRLYSDINRFSLKYLPSTITMTTGNLNIEPTVFLDKKINPEYVYVYFTNTSPFVQNYSVDPTLLRLLFALYPDYVELGAATVSYIQAMQLYSTSGNAKLYNPDLNDCYIDLDHPTNELQSITWNASFTPGCAAGVDYCLTAQPYTIGYFKIPIIPVYLKEQNTVAIIEHPENILVYPNPASNSVYFATDKESTNENIDTYLLEIFSAQGKLMQQGYATPFQEINVKDLPAGCYIISIKTLLAKNTFHNLSKCNEKDD